MSYGLDSEQTKSVEASRGRERASAVAERFGLTKRQIWKIWDLSRRRKTTSGEGCSREERCGTCSSCVKSRVMRENIRNPEFRLKSARGRASSDAFMEATRESLKRARSVLTPEVRAKAAETLSTRARDRVASKVKIPPELVEEYRRMIWKMRLTQQQAVGTLKRSYPSQFQLMREETLLKLRRVTVHEMPENSTSSLMGDPPKSRSALSARGADYPTGEARRP